jgi:MFS superfamily sulfate permease-like transporter
MFSATSTVNSILASVVAAGQDVITTNLQEIILLGVTLALIFFGVKVFKRVLR